MAKSTAAFIPTLIAFERKRLRPSKEVPSEEARLIALWMMGHGFTLPGGSGINREDTLWYKLAQARTNYEGSPSEPNKQALKLALENMKKDLLELSGLLADFSLRSAEQAAQEDITTVKDIIGSTVSSISLVLSHLDSTDKATQTRTALLTHCLVRSFSDSSSPVAEEMLKMVRQERSNLEKETKSKKNKLKADSTSGLLKYFVAQACEDSNFVENFSKEYPCLFNNLFHGDIVSLFNAVEKNQEALDANGSLEVIYSKFCDFYDIDGSSRKVIADLRNAIGQLKRDDRADLINDTILRSSAFTYRARYGESEESRGLNKITRLMLFKIQRDEKVVEREAKSVESILGKLMRLESHLGSCFTQNDFYRFSDVNLDRANRSAWALFAEVSQRITNMVVLSILSEENIAVRDYRISQWILLANELIDRNFYSLSYMIVAGLKNSAVCNSIPDKELIEKIDDFKIFNPMGNFKEYKGVVSDVLESGMTYYPLVPPIKTELTFTVDGNKIGDDEIVISPFVTQTKTKNYEYFCFSKEQNFSPDVARFLEASDPSLHPLESRNNGSDIKYLNDFLLALDGFNSSDYSLEQFFEYSAKIIGFLPLETKIKISDLAFDPAPGACSEDIRVIVNKNKGKDTGAGKVKDEDRDKGISGVVIDFFISKKDKIKSKTSKGHIVSSVVTNLISKQATIVQSSNELTQLAKSLQSEESNQRNRGKVEYARNIQYRNDLLHFLTLDKPEDRRKAAYILKNGVSEATKAKKATDLLQATAAAASSALSLTSLRDRFSRTSLGARLSGGSSSNVSLSSQTQLKPVNIIKPNPYIASFENPDKDPFIKEYLNDYLMLLEFQASYDDAGDLKPSPDLGNEINGFLNFLGIDDRSKTYIAWYLSKNLDHLNALKKVLRDAGEDYATLQSKFFGQVDDANIAERLEELAFTPNQIAIFTVLFYSSPDFGSKQKDLGFNKFFIQLMDPDAFSKWTLEPAALTDTLAETIEMEPLSGMPSAAETVSPPDLGSASGTARSSRASSFLSAQASTISLGMPGALTAQSSLNPYSRLADVVPVLENNVAVLQTAINDHVTDVPQRLIAHHLASTYANVDPRFESPVNVKKLGLRSALHEEGDQVIQQASKVHLTAHLIDNVLDVQDKYLAALDDHLSEEGLGMAIESALLETNKILKELSPKAEAKAVLGSLRERMDQFDKYNVSDVVFLTPPLTLFEVVYYLNPLARKMCKDFPFSFEHFVAVGNVSKATFAGSDNVKLALIAATEVYYTSTAREQREMNQMQIMNNILDVVYDSLVKFLTGHMVSPLHSDAYKHHDAVMDLARVLVNYQELYKINASDKVLVKADMAHFVGLFVPGTDLLSLSPADLLAHLKDNTVKEMFGDFDFTIPAVQVPDAAIKNARELLEPAVTHAIHAH